MPQEWDWRSIDGPEFSCLHILCSSQITVPFQIIIKGGVGVVRGWKKMRRRGLNAQESDGAWKFPSIYMQWEQKKNGIKVFTLNHKTIREKWYCSKSILISKFIWAFSLSALNFSTSPLNLCIYSDICTLASSNQV